MQGSRNTLLKKTIGKLDDIPMLSSGLLRLVKVATDPGVELELVVQEIEKNQAVLLKVLSIANSPLFRGHSSITDAKEAVVRIGLNQIGGVVIALTMGSKLTYKGSPLFNNQYHWLEAVFTAYIVCEVCRIKKLEKGSFLYTAGLLHNMGNMLLVHLFPQRMNDLLSRVQPIDGEYTAVVVDHIGFNQFDTLCWLIEKWGLPSEFSDVIGLLGNLDFGDSFESDEIECLFIARRSALFLLNKQEDSSIEMPPELEQYNIVLTKAYRNFENLVCLANTMAV